MPQITVIVPVYKVEPFIRRCVDSVLSQTFSDFELILVDDGSPDCCGAICDEYAEKDSRIHVIHQENGGLSAARNTGIDWAFANSDSEWLAFIDSDDWVHPRYLELLYQTANKYGVRICQCLHIETSGKSPVPEINKKSQLILSNEQYTQWYSAYAWEKLYATTCFEKIRYPAGKIYEDVAIWYKLLFAETKIGLVQEVLYYYFINPNGIVRCDWKPARLDQVMAWEEQLAYITKNESTLILEHALRRNCGVLKNQFQEIQKSSLISNLERRYYGKLVKNKLKRLLRQYCAHLKQIGIYSDYYYFAYPNRVRLYGMINIMYRNPKQLLKSIYHFLIRPFSKPTILFESRPFYADNTRPVYDELLRRGLDKNYYLVWVDNDGYPVMLKRDGAIVSLLGNRFSISKRIRLWSLKYRVSAIICCNRVHFPTDPKKTTVFYLSHGTPMKSLRGYYELPDYIDYVLAASESVAPISVHEFNIDSNKIVALGLPRNDVFAEQGHNIRSMLNTDCEHIIVWYPTYRQHQNGTKTGSNNALPIIYDTDAAKRLDRAARDADTYIVLKPHFAQDLSLIQDLGLQNIRFIDESFFTDHQIISYQFVNSCDALITDYSSIYYDYTLADKPIAVIWDDLEGYRNNPGFAVDLDEYLKGAVKVFNVEELIAFIQDVASGIDRLQDERREIRDIVNYSNDGNNSSRVADYILKVISFNQ